MSRDGNVGSCSIDGMVAIGVDSIIAALEHVKACHLETRLRFEI